MFNSIGPTTRLETARRFLSLLLSLALHCVVLAALIAMPLLFFSVLPEFDLLTFLIADPRPPLPPPPPLPIDRFKAVAPRPTPVASGDFVPPLMIPQGIPAPGIDEPPIVDISLPASMNPSTAQSGIIGFQPDSLNLLKGVPLPVVAPPPAPKRVAPVRVGGDLLESKLVKRVIPEYPELAKRARASGKVVLQVCLDEEGSVYEVKVLSGHPLLQDAAVAAVRQWKYSPTLLNGEPVPVVAMVTVIFSLRQ